MAIWNRVRLSDIVTLNYGKSLKQYKNAVGEIPVYGTNGLIGYTDKAIYPKAGIIIGRKGAYRGVHYSPVPFNVIDTAFFLSPNSIDINFKFLYYRLLLEDINGLDSGSAIPSTRKEDFYGLEIDLPDYPTQTRIASILSAFDDKIELNHQMNHTLEQMAQALFKKYFVDDIDPENLPEGWRKMKVKELFDISIGRTPPRDQDEWFTRNGRDVKWISIRDLGNGGVYVFETSEFLTNDAVKKFNIPIIPNNTVVLSFKLTVGRVAISTERMLSNEAIAHFIPKVSPFISTEFIYLYLKNFDYNSLGNTSSIATAVNSQTIKDMEFIIPDEDTMSIFSNKVSPLFLKIKDNTTENNTLVKIRDLLLPKLMSGEVKVEQTIVTA